MRRGGYLGGAARLRSDGPSVNMLKLAAGFHGRVVAAGREASDQGSLAAALRCPLTLTLFSVHVPSHDIYGRLTLRSVRCNRLRRTMQALRPSLQLLRAPVAQGALSRSRGSATQRFFSQTRPARLLGPPINIPKWYFDILVSQHQAANHTVRQGI